MKMQMRLAPWFIFSTLALTGCFDIENRIVLRKDTFSANVALRFPRELAEASGEAEKSPNLCVDMKTMFKVKSDKIKVTTSEENDEFHLHCKVNIEGPLDYDLLAQKGNLAQLINDGEPTDEPKSAMQEDIVFKKISGRKMRMIRKLNLSNGALKRPGAVNSDESEEKVSSVAEKELMGVLFAGGSFRQVFEAEKIFSSNGTFLVKDKIVEWKMPLRAALSKEHELWVDFEVPQSWFKGMWNGFTDIFSKDCEENCNKKP